MRVTFVVKARLATGTQVIQLRTGGTALRLGGIVFTDSAWVITDEILQMLRHENPEVAFVHETPPNAGVGS